MSELNESPDINPLLIIEEEIPPKTVDCDNSDDDNESMSELFDFSSSENLETGEGEQSTKRNSLQIVEDKDLAMEKSAEGDLNNNSGNVHRLSLQVESGDENSLVMTNEAINRTIIRIGSNNSTSNDFGEEVDGGETIDPPHEAIYQNVDDHLRRNSENFQEEDGEVIVSLLGQINEIVGFNLFNVFVSAETWESWWLVLSSFFFCYFWLLCFWSFQWPTSN